MYVCAIRLHCCASSPVRLLVEVIESTKFNVGTVSFSLEMASVVSFASVRLTDWVFVAFAHSLYGSICGQGSFPSDGMVRLSSAGIASRYTNGVDRTTHEKRSERGESNSTCISLTN